MKYVVLLAIIPLTAFAVVTNAVPVTNLPDATNPNLLLDAGIIIGPLIVLGAILKNAFPSFPNRLIPLLTWVLGVIGYMLKSGDHSSNGVITAVLVAATATGIHSGIKNSFENRTETPPK